MIKANKILSGKFAFGAQQDTSNVTVNITNGRFDIGYNLYSPLKTLSMKKNIYSLLFLFYSLALMSSGCKKHSGLTKETQTGANTFSCKINGKVFLPQGGGLFYTGKPVYRYYDENSKELGINAENVAGSPYKKFVMRIEHYNGQGTYDINNGNVYCEYREDNPGFKRFIGYTGFIKITKDDQVNKILSGTFAFTAQQDTSNVTVNVTDGRFDIGYNL